MSDERREEAATGGPGDVYQPFVIMEELLDKLKLLRYEESFCRQLGFKPFSRHYFALQASSGEQFYNFTSIAAWLLQMNGRHFEQPQEYDDPNATISGILDELRQLGHTPDFPPSKLKSGSGEHCIWVIDRLADAALSSKAFTWKMPVYPEEEADEENIIEDDAELTLNQVEKELIAEEIEEEFEEEENILGLEDLKNLGAKDLDSGHSKPDNIMENTQDASEWRLEVERVLPNLKVTLRSDNKDWRVHVDQMHQHHGSIDTNLKDTKQQLDKLYEDITRTLEKVASREKYVNNQLEHLLQEFRSLRDQLAETKERYREASGGVTERTRGLADVSDELEKIKQEMDERGTSMTDGTPLVKIKQALQKLRQEISQMDIRIGVVNHILLQAKLKEKHDQNRSVARAGQAHDEDVI